MAQTEEFLGTGRRKRAIARVRLADGSGKVTVNGHDVEDYFTCLTMIILINQHVGGIIETFMQVRIYECYS